MENPSNNGAPVPCGSRLFDHRGRRVSIEDVCCTMIMLHHLIVFWQGLTPMLLAFETELNSFLVIGEPTPVVTIEEEKWIPFDTALLAYDNLKTSMVRAIRVLKDRVGNHCGFGPLSALIDEEEGTHGVSNAVIIGRDLDKQRGCMHDEDFGICGYYINQMDSLVRIYVASAVLSPSHLTSHAADGGWVCVTSLLSDVRFTLETEVEEFGADIYVEAGICPDRPFDPNDPRSVLIHAEMLLGIQNTMQNNDAEN
jgi:hypothetical protein